AQVQQGQTIAVWVEFPSFAMGRGYFGFGASSGGTLSVVVAADSGQLILQDNAGYGFTTLAAVSQTYQVNHWYQLRVLWGIGGNLTARLYDSDGATLLKSVQATDNSITSGGIAFTSSAVDKY